MLELIYIARFDFLAEPNSSDLNRPPDDAAVAMAIADADEASEKADESRSGATIVVRGSRRTLN
ncbi:hypothetical protein [Methylocystis iwaonis]|uniref:Uncharacterized protein n=1 Tax=Methylocystis iwaonis TaxID=2885079 RepID=A0ABM8E9U2_9HYPH|nr:hypothetical protein [Methylocystis iwaonis]BDV34754.1 hypothetical protein SS37A_22830 [Methylocystis iwaonis]